MVTGAETHESLPCSAFSGSTSLPVEPEKSPFSALCMKEFADPGYIHLGNVHSC